MRTKELIENEKEYLMQTYNRPAMACEYCSTGDLSAGGYSESWNARGGSGNV